VGVTVGGLNFEDAVFNSEERDIKSASTQIENQDILFFRALLVQPISDSCRSWLIDNSQHIQARDGSSVLSGLPLLVIEVSGHSNHCILYLGTQERFGNLLHLDEYHRGNLFSLELFLFSFVLDYDHWLIVEPCLDLKWPQLNVLLDLSIIELPSNESLGVKDGIFGVSGRLVLG